MLIDFMDCYLEKQASIDALNNVITKFQHNVEKVEYQLYAKQFETGIGKEEFIIIHYKGGAYTIIYASGNSFYANYKAIGEWLDHGEYYNRDRYNDVVRTFERIL